MNISFFSLKGFSSGHKKQWLFRIIVSACFLFLFSLPTVLSIGVSPPIIDVDYNGAQKFTFDVTILNNGASDGFVTIEAHGDLEEYVSLSEYQFQFKPGARANEITVTVDMPAYNELTVFGKQKITLYIQEGSPDATGIMGFRTAVKAIIKIDIPVPGKLGGIDSFSVTNTNEGYGAPFELVLKNRGTEDLSGTSVKIELRDYKDVLMGQTSFNNIAISADELYTITDVLPTQTYDSSKYYAMVYYTYDPSKAPLSEKRSFFVGSTDVELVEYTPTLTVGKINKINLDLQSLWGSPLKNIRGTISYAGKSQSLPVIDFEEFELKRISTFLDVPLLEEESLDATLELEIPVDESTTTQKTIPLTFVLEEEKKPGFELPMSGSALVIAGLVLALLLVIGINIFIFVKKKNDKKN